MHLLLLLALAGCGDDGDPSFGTLGSGAGSCDAIALTRDFDFVADISLAGPLPVDAPAADAPAADAPAAVGPSNIGGPGIVVADVDGDGWLDVVFVVPVGASMLLLNDGSGGLADSGRTLPAGSTGAAADVDLDGDVDLLIGRGGGAADVLLRNDGSGGFLEEELPSSTDETFGLTLGDLDGDGDPDLFAARFLDTIDLDAITAGATPSGESMVYENVGGRFEVREGAVPASIQGGASYQGQLLDFDGDGDLDVYLTNDFGMWLEPNRLLANRGDGTLQVVDDCDCELALFGMGSSVGDVDGDGHLDLFTTNLGGPVLQRNAGDGGFYDATLSMGAAMTGADASLASWGSAIQDLDGDGHPEILVAFGQLFHFTDDDSELEDYAGDQLSGWQDAAQQPDVLLHNQGGEGFTAISADAGFADPAVTRAVAIGDLDRDGRPDVVTGGVPFVRSWLLDGGCGPGVTVRFDGVSGIGLRAEVEAGDFTDEVVLLPSTTFGSSAEELYLGLGGAAAADRIVVYRGDERIGEWTEVEAGSVLTVR